MTKLPAMVLPIALCGLSFAHAQQAGERTTLSGVFTTEQVKVGKTVANRFRNIRTAMPAGAPGSLDDQTYIDIVAYILQFNGMPAGNQKLMPEVEALEKIVIAAP
jgi:hypothetical protein